MIREKGWILLTVFPFFISPAADRASFGERRVIFENGSDEVVWTHFPLSWEADGAAEVFAEVAVVLRPTFHKLIFFVNDVTAKLAGVCSASFVRKPFDRPTFSRHTHCVLQSCRPIDC